MGNHNNISVKVNISGQQQPHMVVHKLDGLEGLSRLYQFKVKLGYLNPEPLDDLRGYLGKTVGLEFIDHTPSPKVTKNRHGIIGAMRFVEATRDTRNRHLYIYELTVVPRAWKHQHVSACRVFCAADLTDASKSLLQQLLEKVLTDSSVLSSSDFTINLSNAVSNLKWLGGPRDDTAVLGKKGKVAVPITSNEGFRVQYRETNWDFLSRLMEEYGIFYYFTHDGGAEHLVLTDKRAGYQPVVAGFNTTAMQYQEAIRADGVELMDFNAARDTTMTAKAPATGAPSLLISDFLGGFRDDGSRDGADLSGRLAQVRLQEARGPARQGEGESVEIDALPGARFQGPKHVAGEFLLTQVLHQGIKRDALTPPFNYRVMYSNAFTCAPNNTSGTSPDPTFRPPRVTPRPRVGGLQTALVLGSGQDGEPDIDYNGRVKVRFHWDTAATSSCRVRVSQLAAQRSSGVRGTMWYPRKGDEVLVDFLDGDPEQPVVVGCVSRPARQEGLAYTPHDVTEDADTNISVLAKSDSDTSPVKTETLSVNNAYRNVIRDKANEISLVDDDTAHALLLRSRDQDSTLADDAKNAKLITDADEVHERANRLYSHISGDYRQKIGGKLSLNVEGDISIKYSGTTKKISGKNIDVWKGVDDPSKGEVKGKFRFDMTFGTYGSFNLALCMSIYLGIKVDVILFGGLKLIAGSTYVTIKVLELDLNYSRSLIKISREVGLWVGKYGYYIVNKDLELQKTIAELKKKDIEVGDTKAKLEKAEAAMEKINVFKAIF